MIEGWLDHPISKEFFKKLKEKKENLSSALEDGMTLNDPNGAVISTSIVVGRIQALKGITDTIIEEMIKEREEIEDEQRDSN